MFLTKLGESGALILISALSSDVLEDLGSNLAGFKAF